jgi:pyruvate/2-oxoglutarate dehydrogenase complex dihydrolipoamide acyltransferase (E2) component
MVEISLKSLGKQYAEATIQTWFFEEGDSIEAGDDLVELLTEDGVVTIQAPATGVLAEVYYDEGEMVTKEEPLCVIDEEDA